MKNNKININFKKVSVKERLKSIKNLQNIVEVRNLNIFFGRGKNKTHAVKNVSFNVNKGEVFGLVGESGSGKTTIGRAIAGLLNFNKDSSITLKNMKIPNKASKINTKFRKKLVKNLQMIFQDPASSLNPYKTVKKVIQEGLDNIDVKLLFERDFDNETFSVLWKIIPSQKLPVFLKNKSFNEIINISVERPAFFDKMIYFTIYNQFKNDDYIRTYIELRKDLKNDLIKFVNADKKIKEKLTVSIIQSVGLSETILDRYPLEFSGGQQQRIGIARSVVMHPELIIADEPISALDVSIQSQIINIFNDLKEKFNLTFIFIAHDLRIVEYISDRIAVIYRGQIIEIGTTYEVINNPIHPYTKSLIGSIPSINIINESLKSIHYNDKMHCYSKDNVPSWFKKEDSKTDHYVFGTKEEVMNWTKDR